MKKIIGILSLIVLIPSLAFSQKGKIRGVVYDQESGETLIGAAVFIEGTSAATGTDIDGAFELSIEPGVYSVRSSYISYQDVVKTNIEVKAGEVTLLDIYLGASSTELTEVVVEAKMVKNNESAVLLMQKNSNRVMDGISSQQIKRMGDSDAAGAIKRVTGVTVEGGKYVTVRGLGDRYSKTLLNGADIPSLDPEKNAVQMDMFPTNLIDNILVYKTFSPDLPGDFTGGLIDLSTKDFPEKLTFQFTSRFGFNDQTTFNNKVLNYQGGGTDFLGMDDGTRAEPANAKDLPSDIAGFVQNIEKNTEIVKSFNNQMATTTKSPFVNQSYSMSVGNQTKFANRPLGFIVGFTYQKNNNFYDNGTIGRYISPNSGQIIPDKVLSDAQSNEDVLWGLMANLNYKFNSNNKLGLTYMRNQGGNKVTRQLVGRWSENQAFSETDRFYSQSLNWVERSIQTVQLKGEHYLPGFKNASVQWISSYTGSQQDQPDFRLFAYDWEDGVGYEIKQQAYQPPARFYRNMQETNWDNKLHLTIPFTLNERAGNFKVGGAFLTKARDFAEYQYDYQDYEKSFGSFMNDPLNGEQDINPSRILNFVDDDNIISTYFDSQGVQNVDSGMYMRSNRQLSNTYTGNQSVMGAYIMSDYQISSKLKAIFGVRFERTDIRVESLNFRDPIGSIVSNDFLPSINFNYDLNEINKFRIGYSRTLARPTFRELAPFSSYLFAGDYVLVGNPNLDRTLIDNFDFRYEWYPSLGDYLGVGVFYKKFDKPIERRIAPEAQNLEVSFVNVPEATVYGLELEIRKSLDFMSNEDHQTKIGMNASYIYARTQVDSAEFLARKEIDPNASITRPMFGQSPYIVNVYLSYMNAPQNFGINVSLNVWGERLSFVSRGRVPDVYEQPRPALDMTAQKGIGEKWAITFRARNLLNPEFKQVHDFDGQEYIFGSFTIGRTYSIGVKYSF